MKPSTPVRLLPARASLLLAGLLLRRPGA